MDEFVKLMLAGENFRLAAGVVGYRAGVLSVNAARELKLNPSTVENILHAGEVAVECEQYFTDGLPDLRPSHYYAAWPWGHYLEGAWPVVAEILEDAAAESGITAAMVADACLLRLGARPNQVQHEPPDRVPGMIRRRVDDLYSLVERSQLDASGRLRAVALLKEFSELIG